MSLPPARRVDWKPCWRIIPARYKEEKVFDRVTEQDDREEVVRLERLTSERSRREREGAQHASVYVRAAFSYTNPDGNRFNTGAYGVYYATRSMETAVEESRFHRERFLRATKEDHLRLEMKVLEANLGGELHDIRGLEAQLFRLYSTTDYSESQELGRRLREAGSCGIVYDSVHHRGGECAAVFSPGALSDCRQERHLIYDWDGRRISRVFELREYL